MRDDPSVVALVAGAVAGDQGAWNEIIERYGPLVWSVCRRYGLDQQDVDDVGQSVWLLAVENIGTLREPAALPGWLATITRNECLRILRVTRRHDHEELPPEDQMPDDTAMIEQEVLTAERNAALRAAFAELPRRCRDLLSMLMDDPPYAYADISRKLQIAVGSIGAQRARCLKQLGRSSHVRAIADIGIREHRGKKDKGERGD